MNEQTTITQITSRSVEHSVLVALGHILKLRHSLPSPQVENILEIGPGIGVSLGRMRGMFPNANFDAMGFEPVDHHRRIVGVRNLVKDMRWSGAVPHDTKEVPTADAIAFLQERGLIRDDLNLRDQYVGDFFSDLPIWSEKIATYDLIYEQFGPIEKTRFMPDQEQGRARFRDGLDKVTSLLREGGAFLFVASRDQHAQAREHLPEAQYQMRHFINYKERHCSAVFKLPVAS